MCRRAGKGVRMVWTTAEDQQDIEQALYDTILRSYVNPGMYT